MEKTRQYIATMAATVNHPRTVFRKTCDWFREQNKEVTLPYGLIHEIVVEEFAKIAKPETPTTEWPVMLTKEEAVAVAKKVGADEKAEDLKTAIVDKSTLIAVEK